jgi:predicted DNA-binding antitoxin AbrB/MazE fold protein
MMIKAVYRDGVFKPVAPVNLAEGEWVELEIVQSSHQRERNIVSLQGIWKDRLRPEDQGDWVSKAIAGIRHESTEKLDRLARELSKDLGRE